MEQTQEEITFFAKTNFRDREVPFGIKTDDRRRHMYVIGKTGMGKTTIMENMAVQDIRNGHGVCFIDPHGDSVAKILDYIPANRVNDVVYFNPADLEYPIAFNVMETIDPKFKHLVADGLMGVFTKIWANMWSSRMEYILGNTVRALLDSPGNTILGISRMYLDKSYRKRIVDNIQDPMVKLFWTDEYANYDQRYVKEAVAPIQNKVGQFLSSAIIRNIVGQPKSTIDLRRIMDDKKILLVDISKGKIGEDNSALLGAMLVTKLQMAALSRVDIPNEADRPDFYLYVDEFQNFATESFATILSEARKYHLNLIMGHQYIAQLSPDKNNTKIRDAIFGNVGTFVCFRVGAADAEYLKTEFAPTYTPNDLVNLPRYEIILKLMINGTASEPFSAHSLPINPTFLTNNSEKVIAVSRERYSNPLHKVEERISRWMGTDYHRTATTSVSASAPLAETETDTLELSEPETQGLHSTAFNQADTLTNSILSPYKLKSSNKATKGNTIIESPKLIPSPPSKTVQPISSNDLEFQPLDISNIPLPPKAEANILNGGGESVPNQPSPELYEAVEQKPSQDKVTKPNIWDEVAKVQDKHSMDVQSDSLSSITKGLEQAFSNSQNALEVASMPPGAEHQDDAPQDLTQGEPLPPDHTVYL